MAIFQIKACKICGKRVLIHIARHNCDKCEIEKVENKKVKLKCEYCLSTFITSKTNKRFCNRRCRKQFNRDKYFRSKYGKNPV